MVAWYDRLFMEPGKSGLGFVYPTQNLWLREPGSGKIFRVRWVLRRGALEDQLEALCCCGPARADVDSDEYVGPANRFIEITDPDELTLLNLAYPPK